MAYTDFPFTLGSPGPDTRLFPGHEEVIRHLFDPSQILLQVQQVILLVLDVPYEEICNFTSSSAILDGTSISFPFSEGFPSMAALTVARHCEIASQSMLTFSRALHHLSRMVVLATIMFSVGLYCTSVLLIARFLEIRQCHEHNAYDGVMHR